MHTWHHLICEVKHEALLLLTCSDLDGSSFLERAAMECQLNPKLFEHCSIALEFWLDAHLTLVMAFMLSLIDS